MMKKILFAAFTFFLVNLSYAQKAERIKEKGSKHVGLSAGLSVTGLIREADFNNDTIIYTSNSSVAIQGSYDYFVGNIVTLGVQGSVQRFTAIVEHWEFIDRNGDLKTVEDVSSRMNRIYLGGRLLFHYKNTKRVDIYSGLRLGIVHWTNKMNSDDVAFTEEFEEMFTIITRPALGLIGVGARIKFTPQFSGNVEFNIGAPHLFSFGLGYKLKN